MRARPLIAKLRRLRRAVALAGLALAGCGPTEEKGYVLVLDPAYRAEVLATSRDGISAPDGLLWHGGNLYIADEGGGAIRVRAPDGRIRTLARLAPGSSPEDIVRDDEGNLYFSDDSLGGVGRIDTAGRFAILAGPDRGLASTEALALTPSGALLAGEQGSRRILRVERDGRVAAFVGAEAGIRKPESMAFDAAGNLYIADNVDNILYLLTPDGRLHRPVHDREGFSPESIWYASGTLYITDSRDGRLYRYAPERGLETVAAFAGDLANISGVTTDDRGNIYVSVQADVEAGRGYILRLARRR